MSDQETHYAGEPCNLPVFWLNEQRATGLVFTYTGEYNVEDIDHKTWSTDGYQITYGFDWKDCPTWKLNAIPVSSIPTPSDNL